MATNQSATGKEAEAGSTKTQYIWDLRYIDAPIVRICDFNDGSSDGLEQWLYYCQDANFNTTALVDPAGAVVERYLYDPYGAVTVYDARVLL